MNTAQTMKIIRWRSGKLHVSMDGAVTVCGARVTAGRAYVVLETVDWHLHTNCYNCTHRLGVPAGYEQPLNGHDFPIRKKPANCVHDRDPRTCVLCTPSAARSWPCPNGCVDIRKHDPRYGEPTCTVYPPRNEVAANGTCVGDCESRERAMNRANPKLYLNLADSAMMTCYHCGGDVCTICQQTAVEHSMSVCESCEPMEAAYAEYLD